MNILKPIISFVVVVFFQTCCFAQLHSKLEFIGANINCNHSVFVGEVHNIESLNQFKSSFIKYLHQHCGINNIVIEWGRSTAYMQNMFLKTGDTAFLGRNHNYNMLLKDIRRFNMDNPHLTALRFYGIDFERITFVKTLLYILNHSSNSLCRSTRLYQYLSSIPQSTISSLETSPTFTRSVRKKTEKIYRNAQSVFESERDSLKALLNSDYYDVEQIMTNIPGPVFRERDKNMFTNISHLNTGNDKFVCFVGKFHTSIRHQNPFLSRYLSAKGADNFSLINMMSNASNRHYLYIGIPNAVVTKEENLLQMNSIYRSDTNAFKLIHASKFNEITPVDIKGVSTFYMFFDK